MTPEPRSGSPADLVRRIDRIEAKYEALAKEVGTLGATVSRVEQNQEHATELNRLRFDALDLGVKTIGSTLESFMARIEGIVSGEIMTQSARQGAELVSEYKVWRQSVEDRLDIGVANDTRLNAYGRVLQALTVGGGASIVIGLIALTR